MLVTPQDRKEAICGGGLPLRPGMVAAPMRAVPMLGQAPRLRCASPSSRRRAGAHTINRVAPESLPPHSNIAHLFLAYTLRMGLGLGTTRAPGHVCPALLLEHLGTGQNPQSWDTNSGGGFAIRKGIGGCNV